jgi:transcriptional regulator with XRE-family HTH domain
MQTIEEVGMTTVGGVKGTGEGDAHMYTHPQRRSTKLTKKLRNQAGNWLRELRENRGLSQRELAERVGAEYYTFISQLENGRGRIPPDRYLVWADALGVEPRAFVRTLMSYYDPVTYNIIFGEGAQTEPPRTTRVRRSSLPSPNVDRGRRRRLSTE